MKKLITLIAAAMLLAVPARAAGTMTANLSQSGFKQSDFPRVKQLAPGVYSYEALRAGEPNDFMTTNSLFVVTTDGVLVADGQGNDKEVEAMIAAIAKITPQPIKYVIVCSDHGDHTGGNAAFKKAFPAAVFISSPVSQKVLEKSAVPPTETVADKRTLKMGTTEVEILNLGRAHTGGDLSVYVPAGKVLFMSEAYLHRMFPAMRSAYPTEWLATIKKAQAMNAAWYIPGHGFIDDAATMKTELEEYRKALAYVVAEGKRLHAAKVPCAAPNSCEAAQKADWGPYATWSLRKGQDSIGTYRIYLEADGKLP